MLAAFLANEFPQAIFRSGNADGSDSLFARGVNAVSPDRMQLVTPTKGHRKAYRHPVNYAIPLDTVSAVHEETLAYHTNAATPENSRIIDKRNDIPQLKSKARYLLRDTLMVLGDPACDPAVGRTAYQPRGHCPFSEWIEVSTIPPRF